MSKTIIKIDELKQMYVVEKKTDRQISCIVGCNKQTVYRLRKIYGIKRIPKWSRHICEPTSHQMEVIYGTLIGDAHVSKRNTQKNSESGLMICHGDKQKHYVDWKYEQLRNLTLSPPKIIKYPDGTFRWRFRTFCHPFFSALRKEFYPNDVKAVTESILQKLSPKSIAIWFMDDGTNIDNGVTFRFATCSFSIEQHDIMIDFFRRKYGINTLMSIYSGYSVLRIAAESRKDFVSLIKPHVVDSMLYKIKGY